MDADYLNLAASAILKLVAVIGCLVAMIYGARGVFLPLKEKNQGFAPNSLQALAIVFLLPIVVIVALAASIESQALAALLGTVAGYVLSSHKRDGDAQGNAEEIGEREEAQGARSAATETYQVDRRGSEHRNAADGQPQ
jgi:hypothetical protein